VLPVRRRVLGLEYSDTLWTANNLTTTLFNQGKDTEAGTLFREVLEIQQRVLGSEHIR
jgi:hypothetical protein